jgi:hypothetical protein
MEMSVIDTVDANAFDATFGGVSVSNTFASDVVKM